MFRSKRASVLIVFVTALSLILLGAGTTTASAYGTQHLFQVTVSENCQNPVACVFNPTTNPFGIGGIWGWLEPDSDHTAEVSLQFQGHQNALSFLNGSGHITGPAPWSTFTSSTAPFLTPPDPKQTYFQFLLTFPFGTFPFTTPATPGQYINNFGPGINANITVTQMQ